MESKAVSVAAMLLLSALVLLVAATLLLVGELGVDHAVGNLDGEGSWVHEPYSPGPSPMVLELHLFPR